MLNVAMLIILNHGFIASDKLLYVFSSVIYHRGHQVKNNKNIFMYPR